MRGVEIRFLEAQGSLTVLEVDTPDVSGVSGDLDRALAAADVEVLLAERRCVGGRLRQRLHLARPGGAAFDEERRGELAWRIQGALEPRPATMQRSATR
jgi:hypothetical protein